MAEQPTEQRDVAEKLLVAAGIPVPREHLDKLDTMYRAAAETRAALRAVDLGETEPVTTFALTKGASNE